MLIAGASKRFQRAFKVIQHRFNFVSTCFNTVERGGGGGEGVVQSVSIPLFNKIERMLKPFAEALRCAIFHGEVVNVWFR